MNREQRQGLLRVVGVLALAYLCVAEGVAGHFWCSLFFGVLCVGCAVMFHFAEKEQA